MKPKILLVQPPIYDFAAYDFWLKPYGLLRVSGYLRQKASLHLFDSLDRFHPSSPPAENDRWQRGHFYSEPVPRPQALTDVPRQYKRHGLSRKYFQKYLIEEGPFDFALIQTVMTYWYLGVKEVIEDIRLLSPQTKIILGGVYATLCPDHARGLGADKVIEGLDLNPLWDFMGLTPDFDELPFWEGYSAPKVGVLKLADGCPFKCTYCSVPEVYPGFKARDLQQSFLELEWMARLGIGNVAFYDDALLYTPQRILLPFLEQVRRKNIRVNFHTPNALNARFITPEIALAMVEGGFKTFYLGFESSAYEWQKKTGGKIYSEEFADAVRNLVRAGASRENITAYLIVGHPENVQQNVEDSMRFVHSLGIQIMLSEFSPIPGTPDGEKCRTMTDLDEPLNHNKTAFSLRLLGEELIRLKNLKQRWRQELPPAAISA